MKPPFTSSEREEREERDIGLVDDGFETVPGAARFLNVSRSMIYKLMDDRQLTYAKIGRSRRIPRRALIQFAADNLVY